MRIRVEDYFHVSAFDGIVARSAWDSYESRVSTNTMRLLELFDEFRVKSTFFVLGWVAQRYPSLVRHIAEAGHEVASHGFHHQLVYGLTPEKFREDVRSARKTLEDTAGVRVHGYRAPSYSVVTRSLWALDVLV